MAEDVTTDSGSSGVGEGDGGSRRAVLNLVLLAVVIAGFGAFVIQNTDSARVSWLVFEGDAALWLVMLASAIAGAVLALLTRLVLRRRRSD